MSLTPKILLATSTVLFTLGHLPYFREIGYGMLKPTGAVLFILFFMKQVLAKEMTLFDDEHAHVTEPKNANSGSISERSNSAAERAMAPQC